MPYRITHDKTCCALVDTLAEAEQWIEDDIHFMLTSEINPQTRRSDYTIRQEA